MAQAKHPVPAPRRGRADRTSSEDSEPRSPTLSPQPAALRAKPSVAPKKFSVERSAEGDASSLKITKICDTEKSKQLAPFPPQGPPAVHKPECMSPTSANQGVLITEMIKKIRDSEKSKQLAPFPPQGPPAVHKPECMSPTSANQGARITEIMRQIRDSEKNKQLAPFPPQGPPAVHKPECTSPTSANQGVLITEMMKKVTVIQRENDVDTYKTVLQQSTYSCGTTPIPAPVNKHQDKILDATYLKDWWKKVKSWNTFKENLKHKEMEETKIIKAKARRIYNAIQLYSVLLTEHGGTLKDYLTELSCIADNLDKVSKGAKIAGITGGAAGVAGGVAAAGLVLAPFTLGASLALTVVGVGVAAAGGATAASAAIANQVTITQDKKKIESIFQEYEALMEEIQDCLDFITEGLEHLREHDSSILRATGAESARVAAVIQLATSDRASVRAMEANSKASGVMKGFGLGMFFTQKKGDAKLKKGLESKLAEKIRTVVVEMQKGLDELMQLKEVFSECN